MSQSLQLASGLTVAQPLERLLAFCNEEYAYYDAIESSNPNQIEPVDVLATVSMNSFVNSAARVRMIHRGLAAACDPILAGVPETADLRADARGPMWVRDLLEGAVTVRGVLVPVATKVLHRKRRNLIPMLDGVVLEHYLRQAGAESEIPALQDKRRAPGVALRALDGFRHDLDQAWTDVVGHCADLATAGFALSPVRVLEVLVWTAVEPRGYYSGS